MVKSEEAAIGFEPMHKGFADPCLTTWLRRPGECTAETQRALRVSAVNLMERETGFEPATSTLARLHSTAELFPLKASKNITNVQWSVKDEQGSREKSGFVDDRVGDHCKNHLLFGLVFVHDGETFRELKLLMKQFRVLEAGNDDFAFIHSLLNRIT